ncbi:MAG: enhanced intracellular survival protein Eis [Streptosporangiaceae bacterium]
MSSGSPPAVLRVSGGQIRPLTASDGLEAEQDLRHRAFGPLTPRERPASVSSLAGSVAAGRILGAFAGAELIGTARFHDMRQWWHGRPMPMAGVAGVKVAPEYRGQGVGKALMIALLEEIARRRYPVSVLYPATAALYRSLGWELAGGRYEAVVPARSLGGLVPADISGQGGAAGPAALRRAGADDAEKVIAVLGAVHEALHDSGPAARDADYYRCWLGHPDEFDYLAGDGFVSYRWADRHDEIVVHRAVAGSEQTARAIWGLLASHASTATTVRASVGPADPVGWLTREPDVRVTQLERWMLRLVDVPAAVAARGFPPAAGLTAVLRLDDQYRPANSGLWRLEVGAGQGWLTPAATHDGSGLGPDGPVTLGSRGAAALYAGIPMAVLRRTGLVAGGDLAQDAALDGAFAAGAYMADYF